MRRLLSKALLTAVLAIPGAAIARDEPIHVDSRSPQVVLSVLSGNGASGELKRDDQGTPWIDAKAGSLKFTVEFFGCNAPKTLCDSIVYQVGWSDVKVTIDQLNGWNRWVLFCPAYKVKDGDWPRAWYPVKGFSEDTEDHIKSEQDEWLSCLSNFDRFTDDPDGFLRTHQ
jgi:hypothetical protein